MNFRSFFAELKRRRVYEVRYCARSDCMAAHARRDTSSSFEIACLRMRLDDVASFIVNVNYSIM